MFLGEYTVEWFDGGSALYGEARGQGVRIGSYLPSSSRAVTPSDVIVT